MCEFTNKKHVRRAVSHFEENNIKDPRHPVVMERFPHAFQPGYCPKCGKYLTRGERKPSGRATRSMCFRCYNRLVAEKINYECLLCGGDLPDNKIYSQQDNVREIKEHLHDDPCVYYWTLIHNVAVTEPERKRFKLLPEHTHSETGFESFFNKPQNLLEEKYKGKPVKVLR